ncbi:MAG TPA: right-handed parallel beta-helix repeat-containing protein [Jatrophihabitantaceae bacterium]
MTPKFMRSDRHRLGRAVAGFVVSALVGAALVIANPAPANASARTLVVPSQFRTISAAVTAAHNGDTILVSPGTYHENITVDHKYLILKARSSDPSRTTIIGKPGRTPVMIAHVPARQGLPRASLIGFHITGGSAHSGQGGAITVAFHADAIIRNNLIERNHSDHGGGILVWDHSNPTIASNTIRKNTVTLFGGGVYAAMQSSPRIWGNVITGNRCVGGVTRGGGPAGGAIFITNDPFHPRVPRSHPTIERNSIVGNSAEFAGGGIMLASYTDAKVSLNRISGNRSSYGGGIHIENHGASPVLSNNTIYGNVATRSAKYSGSGSGGGISVFGASRPLIGHNSIYQNTASYAGGGLVLAENSTSKLNGNKIFANTVDPGIPGSCGGGVAIAQAAARLTNNVIRNNRGPIGGGVSALGTGRVDLVNNVIVANTATQGGTAAGGGVYIGAKPAGSVSVSNNIVSENNDYQIFEHGAIADYYNNIVTNSDRGIYFSYPAHTINTISRFNGNPYVHAAGGNLSQAPSFYNASAGNFSLQAGSTGIDAGRRYGAPPVDLVGHLRPAGGGVDIGAYELG